MTGDQKSEPSLLGRRNFIKLTNLGAAISLAGCSSGGTDSTTGNDSSGVNSNGKNGSEENSNGMGSGKRPLNWLGLGLDAHPSQAKRYKKQTGISINLKNTDSATIRQTILGGDTTYDAVTLDSSAHSAFESAGVLEPIPVTKLDHWGPNKITKAFLQPKKRLSHLGKQAEKLEEMLWKNPKKKENLMFPPSAIGIDGVAYNPKFVDEEVTSWGPIFEKQYAGRSTFQGLPLISIYEPLMYLTDKDVLDVEVDNMNNPKKSQIDKAVDFLTEKKSAGQFRSIWTNGGQATNLMTSEEIVIGDIWRANLPGIRSSGTPNKYSNMSQEGKQGWRLFAAAIWATNTAKKHNNLDEVYELEDQALGAWYGNRAADVMLNVSQYPNTDLLRDGSGKYGEGMGPEYYDWAYRGKRTYEPVDNPALFVPSEYDWSMEEGDPDPNGQLYNGGTIEKRLDSAGVFQMYPDNASYAQEQFRKFMNS